MELERGSSSGDIGIGAGGACNQQQHHHHHHVEAMEQVQAKVRALAAVNAEIIARIRSTGSIALPKSFAISVIRENPKPSSTLKPQPQQQPPPSNQTSDSTVTEKKKKKQEEEVVEEEVEMVEPQWKVRLVERKAKRPAEPVVAAWRWAGELEPVRDLFSDQIDYAQCHTLDQLAVLNDKIAHAAAKYEFLGESAMAVNEVRKMLNNLERIQEAIGELDLLMLPPLESEDAPSSACSSSSSSSSLSSESSTSSSSVSMEERARQLVEQANAALRELALIQSKIALEAGGGGPMETGSETRKRKRKSTLLPMLILERTVLIPTNYESAVDATNNELVLVPNNKNYLLTIDADELVPKEKIGQNSNLLTNPLGLAIDAKNARLYSADKDTNMVRVFRLTAGRTHIRDIGKKGNKQGEFSEPRSVAVTAEGNIVVSESMNNRIQMLDGFGRFVRWLTPTNYLGEPLKQEHVGMVTYEPITNKIFAAVNGKLNEYDAKGNLIKVIAENLHRAFGVYSIMGYVLVTENPSNKIGKMFNASDGAFVGIVDSWCFDDEGRPLSKALCERTITGASSNPNTRKIYITSADTLYVFRY